MKRSLLLLLAVSTGFDGLRAGAGAFRGLLDLPARARIGPVAFAELSRATDLSPTGFIVYPLYGIGGVLLTCATWIVAVRTRAPRAICYLAAAAAISSLLIMVMTTQAAPLMLRVGSSGNDPVVLTGLLDSFTFWTNLRFLCADVSFLAMLSALTLSALRRQAAA